MTSSAPQKDNSIRLLPAFCSMLLPGLGQLLQKRFGEAFVFLFFFFPCAFLTFFSLRFLWFNRDEEFFILAVFFVIAYLLFVFFALADTILWQCDRKPHCIEPVVVIGVISMLIFLLLPAVPGKTMHDRLACQNKMKQIVIGLHNYHEEYGHFPPAYTVDANGKPLHSWRVLILPYLESENLYKQIRLGEPWDSDYNKQFHSQMPDAFRCPRMKQSGVFSRMKPSYPKLNNDCCYSVVIGKETPFHGSESTTLESIDDKEKTILLVERMAPVNWMNPMSDIPFETASCGINAELTGIGSPHLLGCECGFADGNVHFIPDTLETDELKEMLKSQKDKNLKKEER